jgi:hypothetical protein
VGVVVSFRVSFTSSSLYVRSIVAALQSINQLINQLFSSFAFALSLPPS